MTSGDRKELTELISHFFHRNAQSRGGHCCTVKPEELRLIQTVCGTDEVRFLQFMPTAVRVRNVSGNHGAKAINY